MKVWLMVVVVLQFVLIYVNAGNIIFRTQLEDTEPSPLILKLQEIRQVSRESSSPSARSVTIHLADHKHIPNIALWTFTLITGSQPVSKLQADNSSQTQLQFEGSLVNADAVLLKALDDTGNELALIYKQLQVRGTNSRLAWVGDNNSLRVDTGLLQEVAAGKEVCRKRESPCYYINDDTLPDHIPRCQDVTTHDGDKIKVCDDTITRLQEIREPVHLERSGNNLTVHVTFSTTPTKVEVLVFDVNNPTNVLSPEDYQCQAMNEPRQVHCMQQLVAADHIQTLMVLVVGLDDNGYVLESSFNIYGGTPLPASTPPPEESTHMMWVIAGSVTALCAVVGVGLIIGLGIYLVRKNRMRRKDIYSTPQKFLKGYKKTATREQ
ncbi:uncharacterized protein LOC121879228 [Homarus americanus]|uniref:uncharacterized protein LOC121879228 n=1 Tax=Homarus americanus TaxID=6706 RepID=UPI001C442F0C|nr:uncharacterized protein LOC121879228 [Homarus americanus]XP_042241761.1 uncharacterized protein LOC121879228 [Homarus americanus]XP_042241763.1 uncharacterized protein LOC121879228 [Homarus americanus]XP_042241764.1 uncharacterized protein LOC121879228 [Homarus americanus]